MYFACRVHERIHYIITVILLCLYGFYIGPQVKQWQLSAAVTGDPNKQN